MTSSLKAYIVEMLSRAEDLDGFGRMEAVTALAAQSVTAASLGFGSLSATKYQNKYLWRPDAALVGGVEVDLARMCSVFTPTTGAMAHLGVAYADTTITSEQVGILEYEPARFKAAVNLALQRLRRRDVEIIPTVGVDKYWLGQFSWINEPGDVELVRYRPNPVLSRNRYFQKWNIASPDTAASTAVPDWFTLSGASATSARVTTNTYRGGQYGVQVVAGAGAVAVMTQSVGLLDSGIGANDLRSKIVTVVLVGRATAASKLRAWVSNDGGTTKQYSSYHTGGSGQEELTNQITVSATASDVAFGWEQAVSATCQVSQCFLTLNAISDGVRNDTYEAGEIEKAWDQSAGPGALVLQVPYAYGLGGQIEVHSKRAYPTPSLSTDTADAPLAQVAVGALYLLYRGLAAQHGVDTTKFAAERDRWLRAYAPLAGKHYNANWGERGANWEPAMLTAFPTRIG